MKTFFNGKKVAIQYNAIPPLLFDGAFVTDFQEKANIFNFFSVKQYTLVS